MQRKDILHRLRKSAARKAEKDAKKMQSEQPAYSDGTSLVMIGGKCYDPVPESELSNKKLDALPRNSRPREYDNPHAFESDRFGDWSLKSKGKHHTWARKSQSKKGATKGRALCVYSDKHYNDAQIRNEIRAFE